MSKWSIGKWLMMKLVGLITFFNLGIPIWVLGFLFDRQLCMKTIWMNPSRPEETKIGNRVKVNTRGGRRRGAGRGRGKDGLCWTREEARRTSEEDEASATGDFSAAPERIARQSSWCFFNGKKKILIRQDSWISWKFRRRILSWPRWF